MKLLSVTINKDLHQEEVTRQLIRAKEVEELSKKSNQKLAEAEADFATTLARNRVKWALEEQEHEERLKAMLSEIDVLEKRKQQALIPIQTYQDQADLLLKQAKEIKTEWESKLNTFTELQDKLEEKLTEVADRENAVADKEVLQRITQDGIDYQKEYIITGNAKLSQAIADWHVKHGEEINKLEKRANEVFIAEASFVAKTEKYKRDLEALRIFERQLKDERGTLDREYKRKKK